MHVVNLLYYWTDHVLAWGMLALWVWAFGDCLTRKAAAFPAVDKLTKPAWLAIIAIAALLGTLTATPFDYAASPMQIIALVATVVAAVYLADVRPAVREITGGSGR